MVAPVITVAVKRLVSITLPCNCSWLSRTLYLEPLPCALLVALRFEHFGNGEGLLVGLQNKIVAADRYIDFSDLSKLLSAFLMRPKKVETALRC